MPARGKDNGTSYSIKEFDVAKMDLTRLTVVIGSTSAGKSTAIKNIMYHHRYIKQVLVFSSTEFASRNYSDFIPGIFIHDTIDYQKMNDLYTLQFSRKRRLDKMIEEASSMERTGKLSAAKALRLQIEQKRKDYTRLIILDDMAHTAGIFRNEVIRKFAMTSRHVLTGLIIATQYSLTLPIEIRGNVSYAIACAEANSSYRERLYSNFFGHFPNMATFERVFAACTRDYSTLVANNTLHSNDVESSICWYRSPPPNRIPPFRMCSAHSWQFSSQHMKDEMSGDLKELKKKMKARRKGGVTGTGVVLKGR